MLVSWEDARAFCAWLSKKEDRVYRLPTEAEWEYACRADSTTRFHFGDDEQKLLEYANIADAQLNAIIPDLACLEANDGHLLPAPVGSYKPNAWGLYDLHGNVQQWCSDTFNLSMLNVTGAQPCIPNPALKVIRGGSWRDEPNRVRSAARTGMTGTYPSIIVGFRVLCENPKP